MVKIHGDWNNLSCKSCARFKYQEDYVIGCKRFLNGFYEVMFKNGRILKCSKPEVDRYIDALRNHTLIVIEGRGICDSEGEQYDYNLCKLFKPNGLSPKNDQIWEFCQRKWVLGIQEDEESIIRCKICDRYNKDGVCDLRRKHKDLTENHFCKLFIPKGLSFEIGSIWKDYQRRWIVEQQD